MKIEARLTNITDQEFSNPLDTRRGDSMGSVRIILAWYYHDKTQIFVDHRTGQIGELIDFIFYKITEK